jgi:hypothetical protein
MPPRDVFTRFLAAFGCLQRLDSHGESVIPRPQPRDLPVCSLPRGVATGEILRFAQDDTTTLATYDSNNSPTTHPRRVVVVDGNGPQMRIVD